MNRAELKNMNTLYPSCTASAVEYHEEGLGEGSSSAVSELHVVFATSARKLKILQKFSVFFEHNAVSFFVSQPSCTFKIFNANMGSAR